MPTNQTFFLTLNAGSSSLKFAVFRAAAHPELIASGEVERIGKPPSALTVKPVEGSPRRRKISAETHASSLEMIFEEVAAFTHSEPLAGVGHRVVHGGAKYTVSQRTSPEMLQELRRLRPFDPEHLPAEIKLIEVLQNRFPDLPQVACFDTAFHHDLPRVARLLPIPRKYEAAGIRRYGFHGLSYEFLMSELVRLNDPAAANGRVILAHLGSGASLAAVRNGRSVDTSMGFTPTAGLVMGTRCGDLDPGLISFFARTERMSAEQLQHLVNHESGLLGISETSSDIRDLLARETKDERAAEAVAIFCYQAKKWLGSFAAVLGGIDTLVFAGGIGEHSVPVRERICEGLGFLGIELDPARNAESAGLISKEGSGVAVRVIHTDEEIVIARALCATLFDHHHP